MSNNSSAIQRRWVIIVTLALIIWAYIAAFVLGAEWRFIENLFVTVCGAYCAWKLISVDRSPIGYVIAAACLAVGLNSMIEATLFLITENNWIPREEFPERIQLYAFGNHIRNWPVIMMMMLLSGALHNLAEIFRKMSSE